MVYIISLVLIIVSFLIITPIALSYVLKGKLDFNHIIKTFKVMYQWKK